MDFKQAFEALANSKQLSLRQNEAIFSEILNGSWPAEQVAAMLAAMRVIGEDAHQLLAGAREMRQRSIEYSIEQGLRPIADNCGTGGDGADTFNISTTAAFVAAANGVRVFKHGNRSVSSQCGSSDLLAELGFPLDMSPNRSIALFGQTGLSFIFAPSAHPSLKSVMPIRKTLGVRTVFNLLGPLANPTRPDVQVIGVARREILKPMADALEKLCPGNFAVLCSQDGLDEISTAMPTECTIRREGRRTDELIDPTMFGIHSPLESLKGGNPSTNAAIFRHVISGQKSAHSEAVCLNAAMLIWLSKPLLDFKMSFEQVQRSLLSGTCQKYLDDWLRAVAKI